MKTHLPEIDKDTGPAEPRTRCGLVLSRVRLAPQHGMPTCKRCAAKVTDDDKITFVPGDPATGRRWRWIIRNED